MGYTISYGADSRVEAQWKKQRHRGKGRVWIIAAILAGLCFLRQSIDEEKLQDYLIPGNPDVTRAAFARLTDNLREGEDIRDAMTVFCREIIDSATVLE